MIIVTGGAGFIGSNLVHGLNEGGRDDILIVGDLEDGTKHLGLNGLAFRDFVDYRDLDSLLARLAVEKIEAVFHQGACSDTMEHDGRFMMRVNYECSKRLLDFSLGRCPFLYASSAALYGDGSHGFREEPGCEYPLNVYGFSKFLFDRHVRRVLGRNPTQVVGLRYFNVYGPQENHKGRMASVVYKFHRALSEGGDLELFEGSEDFLRDFVYVEDVVALNLWFLDHPDRSGIFNCGTGGARSFAELAGEVVQHYEGAEVRSVPFPKELEGRYQAYTQADLTRLRGAGYEGNFTSLEDGVAAYVKILQTTGGYHLPSEWAS